MSDVLLSLVLSLTLSSGWTLELCYSPIFSPASGPFSCCSHLDHQDESQILFTVCCTWDCWQLCLPRADATGLLPGQWGHCLRWGCAQFLSCPPSWGRPTLVALWHSDPRNKPSKSNPFTRVLGWFSLTSQVSDLGDWHNRGQVK